MKKTLEEILATVPSGHGFCIRNDEEFGFMANITTPDFNNDVFADRRRECFPIFHKSLHTALRKSIALAKAELTK